MPQNLRLSKKSLLSQKIKVLLVEAFPNFNLLDEHHIKVEGTNLFIDFFLPQLNLAVEVDGAQHDKFNEFFHGEVGAFRKSKRRDRLKEAWAQMNNVTIIRVKADEVDELTATTLLDKIEKERGNGL